MTKAQNQVLCFLQGPVGLSKEENAGRMQEESRAVQMKTIQVGMQRHVGLPASPSNGVLTSPCCSHVWH